MKALLWQFVVPAALLAGFWAFLHFGNVRRGTFAMLVLGIVLFGFWVYQATAALIDAIADWRGGAADAIPERQVGDAMAMAIGCAIAAAAARVGFPLMADLLDEPRLFWLGSELMIFGLAVVAGALLGRRPGVLRLAARAGAMVAVVSSVCGFLLTVFMQLQELPEQLGVFVAVYLIAMMIVTAVSVGLALAAAAIARRGAPT